MKTNKITKVGFLIMPPHTNCGGTYWYHGADEDTDLETVEGTIKELTKTWSRYLDFKNIEIPVQIYDCSKCADGWYATRGQLFDKVTRKELPFKKTIKVKITESLIEKY